MRAVVIKSYGGPEVLEVKEVETVAAPEGDRVRVRVRAAGLNRADVLQRKGHYPAPPGAPAEIPGMEFAGEVEAIGKDVRLWKVGQRVFGITGGGAQADFVVTPESALAEIPESLNWIEAAAMPEVFITAHDALFTQGNLQMGERVLIHAAGSGVGTAAVQLAHAAGAIVYGTSRTEDKLRRVRELGLDESVAVGDAPGVFAQSVQGWSRGQGVDVILDLVGAPYFAANLAALALRGRMVCVGTTGGANAQLDMGMLLKKRIRIVGTVLRSRSQTEKAEATRRFAEHVVPMVDRRLIRPVLDRSYAIEDIRAAHERMESNESFGKIVLTLD